MALWIRAFSALLLLGVQPSIAQVDLSKSSFQGCTDCFNFVAPMVTSADSVSPAEVGLIVYDSGSDRFKGKGVTSPWQSFGMPPGAIIPFAGTTAPAGWLLCDGSSYAVSSYPKLHAVIGDSFGGDGGSNFNVPDMRGRFLRGVDSGTGRDPDSGTRSAMNSGGNAGDSVGSVQTDSFQGHHHKFSRVSAGAASGTGVAVDRSNVPSSSGGVDEVKVFNATSDGVNGTPRVSSETRPVNVNVNYIIKL